MTAPTDIAKRYSKGSLARLKAMQSELQRIDAHNIAGDVVECGVWRGGHIILARMISPKRVCWLYDTFSGMTEPGPYDLKYSGAKPPPKAMKKNWTMASLDEVVGNLKALGLYDESKLRFVVGDVCETLAMPKNLPQSIALLRLDTDWHDSTKMELNVLWPLLVPRGSLIVDDFGHWLGARKATEDFFRVHLPDYAKRLRDIDYTAVMMVKP